ncbi:MAG TPA: type II secretion system protein GspJ [Verrucomicrobiae bacterium]|jgi:prepilin-type N-terminal cleavage/methylation domain-containing protein|nr:type II secretion system protein GspJ [Verrucomicrobiae bacterium]
MNARRSISPARRAPRAAFTLLEVLVAISIFAVLLSAIGSILYTALRLRNNTNAAIEEALPVEDAMDSIQHDLANIVPPTGLFFAPLQTTSITNPLPGQVGPDFYTSAGELDGMTPWGNVEKLDYVLAAPTNGPTRQGKDLYRAVTRNLLPVNPQNQPDESELILSGVQNVTFTYYDGSQWQPNWDTTTQTNLPTAIKVQVQMFGETAAAPNAPLELVVPMDILISTNQIVAAP